jgi:uncharacterized membrane protein YdcZ (DUF606 family)
LAVIKANTTFVDPRIWSLIGIAYYLERYGGMHMQIYTLTNKVIWHIANGIHGVIFVCLSIFLFPKMQVIAFPLSLVLANLLFFCWYTAKHSYQHFDLSFLKFECRTSIVPLMAILVYAVWAFLIAA